MSVNSDTYKDIEKAKRIINLRFYQNIDEFSKYSSLYAFTNENIDSAYQHLNLKNKKVLTIAGSGDHIFNAYLHGAKDVISFDINRLGKYYIKLKQAAFQTLDQEEFLTFFCRDYNTIFPNQLFHKKTYKKIRLNLEDNSRFFWDSLFSNFSGKNIRYSKLFYSTEESYSFLSKTLTYLQPNNYEKIKQTLTENKYIFSDSKFLNVPLLELPTSTSEKFDIIYLSNIPDYIDEIYNKNCLVKFKYFLENGLVPMLTKNGKIMVSYMFFSHLENQKKIPIINRTQIHKKYFKDGYEVIPIDNSCAKNATDDHILIYKK